MHQARHELYTVILLLNIFISACVTVSLPQDTNKDSRIRFTAPSGSFQSTHINEIDYSWKSTQTGATISLFTECNNPTDPSIDSLVTGVLSVMQKSTLESREPMSLSKAQATSVIASGIIEGVPSKVRLVISKKNKCIYMLTYISTADKFSDFKDEFNRFVESVGIP
jgi:hypothetical protein